ncbi:unnamed protein product [Calicophoron daubneyi]|uniref:RecA family profile 1 domain-containing protein n=1 Tax=Calicophoron daubneyi TaxID=300641 RepID=A0AAV2TH48_CALDB
MDPSSWETVHRILQQKKSDEPLLPTLLSDPNLHECDMKLDSFASRQYSGTSRRTASSVHLTRPSDSKDLDFLRCLLRKYWCPQPTTCAQLLSDELSTRHTFPSGSKELDRLLCGGIRTDEITELVGKSAVGKTQLCLSVCASALLQDPDVTVLYLDTKGDFSAPRLLSRIRAMGNSEKLLQRVRCVLVPTITQLTDALVSTRMKIASASNTTSAPADISDKDSLQTSFYTNLKLIIIDSLAMPFIPFMGHLPQLAKSQLAVAIVEIQRLSLLLHQAVLVTNHARGLPPANRNLDETETVKQRRDQIVGCLGTGWAAVPHRRIILTTNTSRGTIQGDKLHVTATLVRNSRDQLNCPTATETQHRSCDFVI